MLYFARFCSSKSACLAVMLLLFLPAAVYGQWTLIGPDGGDVRSLAADPADPDHMFLGTSTGQIFISRDSGVTWSRFAHLGEGDDYVLDNIKVDPRSRTVYVGAWKSGSAQPGGDLFRSQDGGKTWTTIAYLHGKSIRAVALAPSDPGTVVIGALDGVYRSHDGGDNWQRISPEDDDQLRNVESVAIDPTDPNTIYIGTWHLGWKTTDAGSTWRPIKNGVIDDSDVFSIVIDSSNTNTIYLSACSGIYKSEYAAELFHRVQGVPYSARRTRVLKQDPASPAIIYAGTTEGLWRTEDAGTNWRRLLAEVTVNDILIDPRNSSHILLATDRSGVLLSSDGGTRFEPSNRGFSHRTVSALLVDGADSQTIYAGVLNDKEFGGVFVSRDRGQNWHQMNKGIENLDIFTLAQTKTGDIVAGTNSGIFRLPQGRDEWQASDFIFRPIGDASETHNAALSSSQGSIGARWVKSRLQTRIMQLQVTPTKWFAATAMGLFRSQDEGRSWEGGPVLEEQDFRTVQVRDSAVLATTSKAAVLSTDGGWTWRALQLPAFVTTVYGGALQPGSVVWLATRQGALRSTDGGHTWELAAPHLLFDVTAIVYDAEGRRLVAVARAGRLFTSRDEGQSWQQHDTGFSVRSIVSASGRLLAATAFNSVIAETSTPRADAQVAAAQK
jgi:photosystem II stability/assembly factor-like uncharacterized protein